LATLRTLAHVDFDVFTRFLNTFLAQYRAL